MPRPRLVGIAGNLHRPSRSRGLVEALGAEVARRGPVDLRIYDILDAGPAFGAALTRGDLPLPAARIVDAIEGADALIVGTPVYKGAYTGLFKHLFDFVEPDRLKGKPVALTATGGGQRHALVVEHALRPLFAFFSALTLPTAVYATSAELGEAEEGEGYVVSDPGVSARLAEAADQLASLLSQRFGDEEAGLSAAGAHPARGGRLSASALWSVAP